MSKKTCEFICPKCGAQSWDVDIEEVWFDADFGQLHRRITCCDCGCEYTDVLEVVYEYCGYDIEDDDGTHSFDEHGNEIKD